MRFSYTLSFTIPQSFLNWLKANRFKRIGKTFSWRGPKHQSADYRIVRIEPIGNSYQIVMEWWGSLFSVRSTKRGNKLTPATQPIAFDSILAYDFEKFLKAAKAVQ